MNISLFTAEPCSFLASLGTCKETSHGKLWFKKLITSRVVANNHSLIANSLPMEIVRFLNWVQMKLYLLWTAYLVVWHILGQSIMKNLPGCSSCTINRSSAVGEEEGGQDIVRDNLSNEVPRKGCRHRNVEALVGTQHRTADVEVYCDQSNGSCHAQPLQN